MEYELSPGVTIEEVDDPLLEEFRKCRNNAYTEGFVRFQPANQFLPRQMCLYEKRLRNLEVKPDDIWICSFPKTGQCYQLRWYSDINMQQVMHQHVLSMIPSIRSTVGITVFTWFVLFCEILKRTDDMSENSDHYLIMTVDKPSGSNTWR